MYDNKMFIIAKCIHILYDLPECACGGCCHIVTDDDNIDDDDLKWVIEYCSSDETLGRCDRELSKFICELLLQLSYEQRVLLFTMMNDGNWDYDESSVECYLDINPIEFVLKEWSNQ